MEGFHFTFIITICLCSMPVSSLPPPLWDKYLFPFSLVSAPSPLLLFLLPLPLSPVFVPYLSLWGK